MIQRDAATMRGLLDEGSREELRSVDVGGRRLAMTCGGQGRPAVILETGLGAESGAWATVQAALARRTLVCRYDRAGRGGSEPASSPRSAADMVDDLRRLLDVAGIEAPYVLVGHSFGGLLMRLYAHSHPREVAGLVLVDSLHDDQFDAIGPSFPPESDTDLPALRQARAFWNGDWRDPASTVERIDFPASFAQTRPIASLGHLPTRVIVAGTFRNHPLIPPAYRETLQRRWDALQQQFLRLSSAAILTTVGSSGHFVQTDAPRAVIEAVDSLLDEIGPV